MKIIRAVKMLALMGGLVLGGFADAAVEHPVGCYYYWVDERVDPVGVKKDLEWMKSVGITKAFLATDIRNYYSHEMGIFMLLACFEADFVKTSVIIS